MDSGKTSNKVEFLPSLTSLRFFAAIYVACLHCEHHWRHYSIFSTLASAGWIGVPFFFILSGFVLMWNFNADISGKDFIFRRFSRIYPLHLLFLLIAIALYLATNQLMAGYPGDYIDTLANLLLVHAWLPFHPMPQTWNGVSWTLSCEWFFYISAPFLFRWMLKSRDNRSSLLFWLISIWIILLTSNIAAATRNLGWMNYFIHMHPSIRLFEFLVGAYGAILVKTGFVFCNWFFALTLSIAPIILYCLAFPKYGNFWFFWRIYGWFS